MHGGVEGLAGPWPSVKSFTWRVALMMTSFRGVTGAGTSNGVRGEGRAQTVKSATDPLPSGGWMLQSRWVQRDRANP